MCNRVKRKRIIKRAPREKENSHSNVANGKGLSRTKSLIWLHYQKVPDTNEKKCLYCEKLYSSKTSTTTLWYHYEKCLGDEKPAIYQDQKVPNTRKAPDRVGCTAEAFDQLQRKLSEIQEQLNLCMQSILKLSEETKIIREQNDSLLSGRLQDIEDQKFVDNLFT